MLSLRAATRPFLPSQFPLQSPSSFKPRFQAKMSASANSIVEHVVLFKVKQGSDPTPMITSLNSLVSLDQVLHLSAGPIHRTRSSPFPFTHMLHSRYSSKEDLQAYSAHPDHVSAVKEHVLPSCDDIMAVDWVSNESSLAPPAPGSAMRVTFLKLKEGLGAEVKDEILGVVKGIKDKFGGGISQLSCGENFSPGRAKGYSLASIAVFPGLEEMEAVDSKEEIVESQKQIVRDHLESVIVLDYLVPPDTQPSTL